MPENLFFYNNIPLCSMKSHNLLLIHFEYRKKWKLCLYEFLSVFYQQKFISPAVSIKNFLSMQIFVKIGGYVFEILNTNLTIQYIFRKKNQKKLWYNSNLETLGYKLWDSFSAWRAEVILWKVEIILPSGSGQEKKCDWTAPPPIPASPKSRKFQKNIHIFSIWVELLEFENCRSAVFQRFQSEGVEYS